MNRRLQDIIKYKTGETDRFCRTFELVSTIPFKTSERCGFWVAARGLNY